MSWKIMVGDVLDKLAEIDSGSVQCVVTSPPYWGLRDYGVDGMIGLEPTLAEHMAKIVEVFAEVRRVLRDDGTLWLNYGDAYTGAGNTGGAGKQDTQLRTEGLPNKAPPGLKPKQRIMLPARVALALQDSGWWVRSEIVWAKGVSFCPTYSGSCMPSSVRDRPTDSPLRALDACAQWLKCPCPTCRGTWSDVETPTLPEWVVPTGDWGYSAPNAIQAAAKILGPDTRDHAARSVLGAL